MPNSTADLIANLKGRLASEGKKNHCYPRPKKTHKEKPILTKQVYWEVFKKVSERVLKTPFSEVKKPNELLTVLRYFMDDPNFNEYGLVKGEASLGKGWLIYGDLGVGKSVVFKIMSQMGEELRPMIGCSKFNFKSRTAPEVVMNYMEAANDKTGSHNFKLDTVLNGRVYFDDLGVEELAFNKTNLFDQILFQRHANQKITFVTTNLSIGEYIEKYGVRLGDRMPEMFNVMEWRGDSLR